MIDIQLHDQLIHGYGGPTDGGWEFVMAIWCHLLPFPPWNFIIFVPWFSLGFWKVVFLRNPKKGSHLPPPLVPLSLKKSIIYVSLDIQYLLGFGVFWASQRCFRYVYGTGIVQQKHLQNRGLSKRSAAKFPRGQKLWEWQGVAKWIDGSTRRLHDGLTFWRVFFLEPSKRFVDYNLIDLGGLPIPCNCG